VVVWDRFVRNGTFFTVCCKGLCPLERFTPCSLFGGSAAENNKVLPPTRDQTRRKTVKWLRPGSTRACYAASDRASVVKPLLFSAALPQNNEHDVKTQRNPPCFH
jgi:hypothetical protein